MKAKDLIEELSQVDPETEIFVFDASNYQLQVPATEFLQMRPGAWCLS